MNNSLKDAKPSENSKPEEKLKEPKKIDESRNENQRKSIEGSTLKKSKSSGRSVLKPNLNFSRTKTQNLGNFTSNVTSSFDDVGIQNIQALNTSEVLETSDLVLPDELIEFLLKKSKPNLETQMDIDLPVSDLHDEAANVDTEIKITEVGPPALKIPLTLSDQQYSVIPNDKVADVRSEADMEGIKVDVESDYTYSSKSSFSSDAMSQESLPSPIYSPIDTPYHQVSQKASPTVLEMFDSSLSEVESLILEESTEGSTSSTSLHIKMEYRTVKMMSWCLDGIESFIHEGGEHFVSQEMADIVCLQNLTCDEKSDILSILYVPDYIVYYAFGKNSNSLAVFTKKMPKSEVQKSGFDILDEFATVMMLEFEDFRLLNVCAPDAGFGLTKLQEKIDWFEAFNKYVAALQTNPKRLIIAGNLKVALEEIGKNFSF